MSNSLFIPEVARDMLNEVIEAQLKISRYAKVDKTLAGRPGNKIQVPKWDYIGAAIDTNPGASITMRDMGFSKDEYTIKKAALGVTLTQEDINDGAGDPKGTAIRQLGKAIADKVENDIFDKANETKLIYNGTAGSISYNGIVAADSIFGDEEESNEKVMFIHPDQFATLLGCSEFQSKDKFDKSCIVKGAIGQIANIWIKKSARVRHDDVTAGTCTVTIASTVVTGEEFNVNVAGKNYSFKVADTQTVTAVAAGIVAAITADADALVSAANASGVITITEKTGNFGMVLKKGVTCSTDSAAGTITYAAGTTGVTNFKNPIIKLQADSKDTEYSETELPALTIFLKKDANVVDDYVNTTDVWNITATKYYGVALTNGAKVVVAKFK